MLGAVQTSLKRKTLTVRDVEQEALAKIRNARIVRHASPVGDGPYRDGLVVEKLQGLCRLRGGTTEQKVNRALICLFHPDLKFEVACDKVRCAYKLREPTDGYARWYVANQLWSQSCAQGSLSRPAYDFGETRRNGIEQHISLLRSEGFAPNVDTSIILLGAQQFFRPAGEPIDDLMEAAWKLTRKPDSHEDMPRARGWYFVFFERVPGTT